MNQLSVRRSDPFGSLVDDVFTDFFQRTGVLPTRGGNSATVARARMDVVDKGDKFEIKLDLPGVSKEESESKDGERVLHSERTFTSYARSLELPTEVTDEGAEANFENGVLTLTLPKRGAVTSKRLQIR